MTITRTHTETFNTIEFADPFKQCEVCGCRVTGVLMTKGRWPNLPCEHVGYKDACPSWGPVDGCRCEAQFGYVQHPAVLPQCYASEQDK